MSRMIIFFIIRITHGISFVNISCFAVFIRWIHWINTTKHKIKLPFTHIFAFKRREIIKNIAFLDIYWKVNIDSYSIKHVKKLKCLICLKLQISKFKCVRWNYILLRKTLLLHVEYLPRVKQKLVYANFLLIM